jgi:hypothetical protein
MLSPRAWHLGPAIALVALFGVAIANIASSPTHPVSEPHGASDNYQQPNGSKNQNPSPFLVIGQWTEAKKDVIAGLTAIAAVVIAAVVAWVTGALWKATKNLAVSTEDLSSAAREQVSEMKLARVLADKNFDLSEKQFLLAGRQCDLAEKQHGLQRVQFFATHPPNLIVRKINLGTYRGGDPLSVTYVVANVGASDAVIIEHSTLIAIEQEKFDGTAPNLPYRSTVKNTLVVGSVIKPGDHIGVMSGPTTFKYDERWQIEKPPFRPIFIGCVRYEDGLGNKRRTEFHRSYDRVTGRFSVSQDPDEEYTDE